MKKIAFMFVAAIVMASCGAKEEKKANEAAEAPVEQTEEQNECCEGNEECCEANEECTDGETSEETVEEAPVVEETAE